MRANGKVATSYRTPFVFASRSVSPTPATCGSVYAV